MEEKTKIKITKKPYRSLFEKGDVGYIDGYIRGGDGRPYVVIVVPEKKALEIVEFYGYFEIIE